MKKRIIIIELCICVLALLILINKLYTPKNEIKVQNTTYDAIPSITSTTTTKTTKKVVKTTKKKTTKKVVKRVSGFNVKASKSEMQQYARSILNEKDYQALDFIITRESGWNPNNVNKKSGASGLCQSLPASKMAVSGKDYKTNYKTQINWCILYCNTRYGSIQNAKKFWLKHHWF